MTTVHFPVPKPAGKHRRFDDNRCPWCDQAIPHEKFEEITNRITARERQHHAEIAARLEEELETKARTEIADLEEARETAEKRLEALKAEHAAALDQRLAAERDAFEAAKAEAVRAVRLEVFEEKLKLQEHVQNLERKIENKVSGELGDVTEVNLFEELKGTFPEDRISRVEKGAAGPDIVHDVYYNGKLCGRIVYDAKNRNAWRNDYAGKLRQDQIDSKADHAVLASHVFPAGAREVHLQDGVIVTHPSRAVVLAQLLRRHLLQTHALRMSNDAKTQKTAELYAFITSDRCAQFLASIAAQSGSMLDMDEKERKAHEATWRKRDDLIRSLQRVHGQLTSEIERILGMSGD